MWSRYNLGNTPAQLPFTYSLMEFLAARERRRTLYLQARKPCEFSFGEEHIVPRVITTPPLEQARSVVLAGVAAAHSRLLADLSKLVEVEQFSPLDIKTIVLRPCSRCPVPSWLPFPASNEGTYGYCSCPGSPLDFLVISPYHRAKDPCSMSSCCPVGSCNGYWIIDITKLPTRTRQPGDIWVGAFLEQSAFESGWWDTLCQFFNDLHINDKRVRLALDDQIGWVQIQPELLSYIKHLATTQGNQVMRRDLVSIQDRYSVGYLSRNGPSIGLAVALAARITSHAILAGQGDCSECYKWTFLCLGSPRSNRNFVFPLERSLIPDTTIVEGATTPVFGPKNLKMNRRLPHRELCPIGRLDFDDMEDIEDFDVVKSIVAQFERVSLDEPQYQVKPREDEEKKPSPAPSSIEAPFNIYECSSPRFNVSSFYSVYAPSSEEEEKDQLSLWGQHFSSDYEDASEFASIPDIPPSSSSSANPQSNDVLPHVDYYAFGGGWSPKVVGSVEPETYYSPTSPTPIVSSMSRSSDMSISPVFSPQYHYPTADDVIMVDEAKGKGRESPVFKRSATPEGFVRGEILRSSMSNSPTTPKRPLPLPKTKIVVAPLSAPASIEEEAYAMDEMVNERDDQSIHGWEYQDEKLSFEKLVPSFRPASTTWLGEHEVEQGDPSTVISRSSKPFVPEKRSGFLDGVTFGREPIVFESSTATMSRCMTGRLTKNLRPSVASHKEYFEGKKISCKRIGKSALFWPNHLKCDPEATFMSKDLIEVADQKEELAELATRMKPNSVRRALKVLQDITDCKIEWDEETKLIKVFIKGDDKVAKDKPRLIQFVPTVVWVRTILKIENILKKIKDQKNWDWHDKYAVWKDSHGNKRMKTFIWASGMTQKQLFDAVNSYMECGEGELVFICGDDNSDSEGDSDAGTYDASQKGPFFELQCAVLSKMGFSDDEIGVIFSIHSKVRTGSGMEAVLADIMLPSGAPWTLFLNTLGLIVFHRQLASVLDSGITDYAKAVKIAGKLLGLNMEFIEAPRTDGGFFSGSEFLKHIFVPLTYKEKGVKVRKLFPVQLPSRVFKWGCMNIKSDRATRPDLLKHVGGVALGQCNFLMEPFITQTFVNSWACHGSEKVLPNWANITCPSADKALTLPEGVSWKDWEDACAEVLVARYASSRTELEECRRLMRDNGSDFGSYRGGLFARMVDRDYAGRLDPM